MYHFRSITARNRKFLYYKVCYHPSTPPQILQLKKYESSAVRAEDSHQENVCGNHHLSVKFLVSTITKLESNITNYESNTTKYVCDLGHYNTIA